MNQFILFVFAIHNFLTPAPKVFRGPEFTDEFSMKMRKLGNLPPSIKESSGLAYYKGRLYTHGDSGNDPLLYSVSYPSLENYEEQWIHKAKNRDWEDVAVNDKGILYIADTGNNANTRDVYTLYRYDLAQKMLLTSTTFKLEDQHGLDTPVQNKSFDLESLFLIEDQVLLLTKERSKRDSRIYQLSSRHTNAMVIDSIPVCGMATGAAVRPDHTQLFVLTYSHILVYQYNDDTQLFTPISKKKSPFRGQVEAFCFIDANTAVLTNENGVVFELTISPKKKPESISDPGE